MDNHNAGPLELNELAQVIRKSHCSNKDSGHACVGVCTIKQTGIELACTLCGKDDKPIAPISVSYRSAVERAKELLRIAGTDYDKLSGNTQRDLVREIIKDNCPGCNQRHDFSSFKSLVRCTCGAYERFPDRGWSLRNFALEAKAREEFNKKYPPTPTSPTVDVKIEPPLGGETPDQDIPF